MKLTPNDIIKNQSFYTIPIYQRLFEWGTDQITTLLEDLWKSFETSKGNEDYYIGMLTSTSDNELVDGQQRFTVIMLMGYVLQDYDSEWKNFLYDKRPRLHFASRPNDDVFLQSLIDSVPLDSVQSMNSNMKNGIDVIKSFMDDNIKKELKTQENFASYILNHLSFFITQLPEKYNPRDLNKYFERMNTSGKNLEQHEILKVKLLRHLPENVSQYMHLWNKLSDVDTLLIRKRHNEEEDPFRRRKMNAFKSTIQELIMTDIINDMNHVDDGQSLPISKIPLSSNPPKSERDSTKDSHCALTFPYLLLQTLYLNIDGKIKGSISDFFKPSNMLETFQEYLPYEGDSVSISNIIDFMDLLVKCRLALDICFIRPSEYGYSLDMNLSEEDESLKKLMMLESMLYVSSSNYTHYRWFGWLMYSIKAHQGIPSAGDLYSYLQQQDIELEEHKFPTYEELSYGEIRYWLWRLDLYIWENRKELFANNQEAMTVVENYIFRRNRSIEHIAPQQPKSDSNLKWDDTEDDRHLRDSFGNLVMISQGLNSALSNESYEVKTAHVQSYISGSKSGTIESLKLLLVHQDYKTWDKNSIKEHGEKMYECLQKAMKIV